MNRAQRDGGRGMRRLVVAGAALWMAGLLNPSAGAQEKQAATAPPLQVVGDRFLLRGKPFQILSGELEYARIPRADWKDRLRKVHAMGLNTITIYVFWNLHEPRPGVYDFSGQKDVAEFIREAAAEGLYVVLRPGPYVCAEWDLGGYPAWLLKDHSMVLRSSQANFLDPARRWMKRLGQELAPLQASNGGPILAVQVENEYGSFTVPDDGGVYLRHIHQILLDSGFTGSLLYTADGGDVMAKGTLPGVFAAVDYGTGDAQRSLDLLKRFRPDTPVYAAEYWDGWFDHWGEKHQVTDAAKQEAEIRGVIEKGYSINLYVIHGGTTFGWMNGANSDHDGYQPDVSSYDYDAPIDESGRPRPKYFALRDMIQQVTHQTPIAVPDSPPMMALPELRLSETRSLWAGLPKPIHSETPLSMEDVDQAYGYILYRTTVPKGSQGDLLLHVDGLHSYARVYVNGTLSGVMDRRLATNELKLSVHGGERLDLLVENSGRINFTTKLLGERAGILGDVHLGSDVLHGWDIVPLPIPQAPTAGYKKAACAGPCFYQGDLQVSAPADTYLNTERLGKGVVWVNGHLLGRFWNIGPSGSLFLPGAWLQAGKNRITVLDLNGGPEKLLKPEDYQTYVEPRQERTSD
ncbi:beta-galactosidase family protein [Granulicella sp. dw_53]|uniref:glycoside hydrolase family 35 protein n=1 Tax=Granulicella sp. dw_53 TaxID=2719792 RepID=UPI002104B579|nr:beta-galactosidase family protein [Granulicella sp. dw_53]